MTPNIIRMVIIIAAVHLILVALFVSVPIFCSQIKEDLFLILPATTTQQMKKLKLTPLEVSNIMRNGTKLSSFMPRRFLYVCNSTAVGIVHDESTGIVVNIIPKICAYEYQTQKDAVDKKRHIRIKSH